MSYELNGKLVAVYDTVQRSETFRTREFVVEKSEQINGRTITNYVKFQCVQDKTSLPDRFKVGDEVKVFFNLKGSRWEKNGQVNYITNLDAWRMEQLQMGGGQAPSAEFYPDAPPAGDENDLPF
ncbi:DUF3127 domain-containing protein [Parasegetibacter sp. NRK P23]|uniref:DUF3127 domain-containing protein n=1 Tax=Parasegetibacter sp. NRK P23 TaxID=2942999 RepID=UPI002042F2D0|nr:DUF3127 domain-containing protein [Parasegetibacter sp. NRK P23]MCM5530512.1 DUF3127 domain-containing protein [Parasegetibacter sp. NRK P23]